MNWTSHGLMGSLNESSLLNLNELVTLDLGFNNISGKIPLLPSNLTDLRLNDNMFTGSVTNQLDFVKTIYLNNNNFSGKATLNHPNMLFLQNNHFTSVEVTNTSGLTACDISGNQLDSESIFNLQSLCKIDSMVQTQTQTQVVFGFASQSTMSHLASEQVSLTASLDVSALHSSSALTAGNEYNSGLEISSMLAIGSSAVSHVATARLFNSSVLETTTKGQLMLMVETSTMEAQLPTILPTTTMLHTSTVESTTSTVLPDSTNPTDTKRDLFSFLPYIPYLGNSIISYALILVLFLTIFISTCCCCKYRKIRNKDLERSGHKD